MAAINPMAHWQRKHIFALLKELNIESQRSNIVSGFTSSGSMKDMSFRDADEMIKHLQSEKEKKYSSINKRRRYLISLCYGMPENFCFWDWYAGEKKYNAKGLDNYLLNNEKSPFKKRLNDLDGSELSKLIAVFEKMHKFYNK